MRDIQGIRFRVCIGSWWMVQERRFVAYYRVSSDSQEDNNSLENQRRRIESWATVNEITIVSGIEAIESATCAASERKQFQRALEIIQKESCDGLVVYDMDRFFRNTEEGLRIARTEFLTKQKTLISLNQNIDISTDDGWFTFGIFLLVAEKEARSIRRRMNDGKTSKQLSAISSGKQAYLEGSRPYGYTSVGAKGQRELVIDPDEFQWRQRIFAWHQEGRSSRWISKELNRQGVPTKRGRKWRDTTVRIILNRPLALAKVLEQVSQN